MIRTFGADKIWKIHFRNVSAPLPHFVETFMDNGYYDMYKIMKALRDVNYDGIVILDHSPSLVGGQFAQTAYGFAYMRALLNRECRSQRLGRLVQSWMDSPSGRRCPAGFSGGAPGRPGPPLPTLMIRGASGIRGGRRAQRPAR